MEFQANVPEPYLWHHPIMASAFITVLAVGSLFGSFGNAMTITAVLSCRELATVGNMFIVNLACADMCVSAFVGPLNIVGIVKGEQFFAPRPGLCVAIASVCLTACICSLLNIAAVAANRYLNLFHKKFYGRVFTPLHTLLICVLIWIISFLLEMPNFLGWGGHGFDRKTLGCVWDRTADYSYTIFFCGVIIGTCVVATFVCYLKIFLQYHRLMERVRRHGGRMMSTHSGLRTSHRLARTFCVIFALFVACWLPYAVVVLTDRENRLPLEAHAWVVVLAHSNSCVNWFVYGLTNRQFRRAYQRLLVCCCCKCSTCCREEETTSYTPTFHESSFYPSGGQGEGNGNGDVEDEYAGDICMYPLSSEKSINSAE